jgi:hypothetical protein
MKSLDDRVKELIEIKSMLSKMGLLQLPEFAEKIKTEMNAFVCVGQSSTLRWRLDNDSSVVITLSSKKQSGLVLEK